MRERKKGTLHRFISNNFGTFYSTISFLGDAHFIFWDIFETTKLVLGSPNALKVLTLEIPSDLMDCHKAGKSKKIGFSEKPAAYGLKTLTQ